MTKFLAHAAVPTRPLLIGLASIVLLGSGPASAQNRPLTRNTTPAAVRTTTTAPVRGANCFSRINNDEQGHSLTNAYLFALVSHYMYPHAYSPNPGDNDADFELSAKPLFESWGMKVGLHSSKNIQYAVMSNDATIVVAFRGSDSMTGDEAFDDWIATNALAAQRLTSLWGTVMDGGKQKSPGVHSGIYQRYLSVRNEINTRIRTHGGKSKKLFVTGHSLGGALAVLCAIDQGYAVDRPAQHRFVPQGVYTYGAPRVGNGLFARLYKSKQSAGGADELNTHRYVNVNDIIPMLPGDSLAHDALYVPLNLYGLGEPHLNVRYDHVGRTSNILHSGSIKRDDQEFRGIGDWKPHHSKSYSQRIFAATIAEQSWADRMPEAPLFPRSAQ